MSGVRRRGYFTAAVALIGAALLTALLAGPPDRPVDVRLVAPPPPGPETVSATATTTVSAVAPVPAPPPTQTQVVAPAPPKPEPTKSSAPTTTSRPRGLGDLLRCDYRYFDDDFERCLPWPLTRDELCEWLDDHHLIEIEVRGPDGKDLDLDHCDD